MVRLLAVLVPLIFVSVVVYRVAQADPPARRVIDEIRELRQQVGPAGQVVGDQREFAQALENVADRNQGAYQAPTQGFEPSFQNDVRARFSDDNYGRGTLQWSDDSGLSPHANQAWVQAPAANPVQPASGYDSRWEGPRSRPAFGRPQPPGPPRGPKSPEPPQERSPQELLRTSAFELDRLAHGLEMAEQFNEADALREAADKLRKSARKSGGRESSDRGPAAGDRKRGRMPRGKVPAKAKQLLKELEANRERSEQLKADLLRHAKENTDRMVGNADKKIGQGRHRSEPSIQPSLHDQDGRLPRIDRPELPKRNLDLLAPPRGIRGGPTDQLEEAIEAARSQSQQSQPSQPVDPPPAQDE